MNKTDRYIIAGALLLLLIAVGAYLGYDRLFGGNQGLRSGVIASIEQGQGDMRVKFKDEFHWQTAHLNQQLVFDDAIFAGEKTRIALKVGNSKLSMEPNTLIVLRKDDLISTLNLNYGSLQGLIALGDHIMVEAGSGEKIELSSKDNSNLTITKSGGEVTVRVKSGSARVVRAGKVQVVTPQAPMVLVVEKPAADPLQWLSPQRSHFYTSETRRSIPFRWTFQSRRKLEPGDIFFVELSDTADFRELILKETVISEDSLELPIKAGGSVYARVRDSRGNSTGVKQLFVAAPVPLQVLTPVNGSALDAPSAEVPLRLKIGLAPLPFSARAQVQVSNDPDFNSILSDKSTTVPEVVSDFSPGVYHLRARALYDADQLQSRWSAVTSFAVREPLDLPRMARTGMPYRVVIPNDAYPKELYKADDEELQKFTRQIKPFPEFFSAYLTRGHDLVVGRNGDPASERRQTSAEFPTDWIYPGKVDIAYRIESGGVVKYRDVHRLLIDLEPPKNLKANRSGQLSWTPLLFARSYEGELRDRLGRRTRFESTRPAALAPSLELGMQYVYRVRAIGRARRPISDWSAGQTFETAPLPPPPPPVPIQLEEAPALAKDQPPAIAPIVRMPAQTSANSSALRLGSKDESFLHRMGAWLWAGGGFNFVLVRQTIASTADVVYKNTSGPSGGVEAGFLDLGGVGAVVSYKRTPGQVEIDNYPVNKKDFIWDTSSAEGLYRINWHPHLFERSFQWVLRGGLQYQQFPFLYVGDNRALVQGQNNMTTASLGFLTETSGRLKYHWSMRYQQPIHTSSEGGNSFSVTPKVAFDGSVGASYLLTDNLKTGAFWYGQLHDYRFTYTAGNQTNTGGQSLFFSTMELRMGYEF